MEHLEQGVLTRPHNRQCLIGRPQFAQDIGDVLPHRRQRNDKLIGNLATPASAVPARRTGVPVSLPSLSTPSLLTEPPSPSPVPGAVESAAVPRPLVAYTAVPFHVHEWGNRRHPLGSVPIARRREGFPVPGVDELSLHEWQRVIKDENCLDNLSG